ncbi:uncharacterized protein LOC135201445 isoform X1 [Macrobrachium nipponense]|uniref:uncharacterized protein LOC135201445 isoform X1 n=2 Tax=Macrobrachium nipponense TaxID=159736 RepID=UPI0030C8718F
MELETFILSEKDKEGLRELVEVGYIPQEPVCVGIKSTAKEMAPFIADVGNRGLGSGASFGMREKPSGRIIGVMSNFVVTPDDSEIFQETKYDEEKSNWYSNVMRDFSTGVDVFQGKFKKCLELMILCVHPDYTGKGLAKKLVKLSEEKGREIGCDVLSIQATNIITYHISKKLGFQEIHRQELDTLTDEKGRPVLDMEFLKTNGTTFLSYLTKAL